MMKKSLIAAAALLSFSAVSFAQSSVTLFGRLDAGLEYMNGVQNAAGRDRPIASGPKAATGARACGV